MLCVSYISIIKLGGAEKGLIQIGFIRQKLERQNEAMWFQQCSRTASTDQWTCKQVYLAGRVFTLITKTDISGDHSVVEIAQNDFRVGKATSVSKSFP